MAKMENGSEMIKDFVQAITTIVTTAELIAQLISVLFFPDIAAKLFMVGRLPLFRAGDFFDSLTRTVSPNAQSELANSPTKMG